MTTYNTPVSNISVGYSFRNSFILFIIHSALCKQYIYMYTYIHIYIYTYTYIYIKYTYTYIHPSTPLSNLDVYFHARQALK